VNRKKLLGEGGGTTKGKSKNKREAAGVIKEIDPGSQGRTDSMQKKERA